MQHTCLSVTGPYIRHGDHGTQGKYGGKTSPRAEGTEEGPSEALGAGRDKVRGDHRRQEGGGESMNLHCMLFIVMKSPSYGHALNG